MRWISLLFCFSLLANQDPTHLAVTEGYPSFLIDGCVSAITGDYYHTCDDIVVQGAEPIRIPRTYLSSRHLEERGGWSNLEHLYANRGPEYYHTTEINGTKLAYKVASRNQKCNLSHRALTKITNCARGELSARNDLSNQYIVPNCSGDHFRVYAAGGTTRVFKKTYYDNAITYFHLQREELPNGHLVHYRYDSKHNLTEIKTTNADGSKTFAWAKFHWTSSDGKSQNHKITTSDGQSFDLLYKRLKHYDNELYQLHKEEISILRRSTSWNGPQEQYEYYLSKQQQNPRLSTIHLPNRHSRRIHYHEPHPEVEKPELNLGTVKAILDGNLNTLYTFVFHPPKPEGGQGFFESYDAVGNKTIYASSHDRKPVYIKRYDGKKLISSEHFTFYGHRIKTVSKFNEAGHLIHKREYTYDEAGNVIQEKFTHDGQVAITKRTFTRNHLLKSETNPAGLTTTYTYHVKTDLIKTKKYSDPDGIFLTETYTYDADNLLVSHNLNDGITNKTIVYERIQAGAFIGMPAAITEIDGEKQLLRKEFEYNKYGLISKERVYDAKSTHRYTLETTYDNQGRLVCKTDALGQETSYTYDHFNNILSVQYPSGTNEKMEYDYRDRLTKKTINGERESRFSYNLRGDLLESTDYRGQTTTYTYDGPGRLIQKQHPLGRITSYTYDASDNCTSETNPLGATTSTKYTALNLPLEITFPDGTTITKTYDPAGRLISKTNQNNITSTYSVDTLGRMTSKKTPLTVEQWSYSSFDVLTYTDAENNITHYTYDSAGRKTGEELAGETTHFEYDELGRLHKTLTGPCVSVTEYDLLNRPIEERSEDLDGKIYTKIGFAYDQADNKTAIIRFNGTEKFTYDLFSRITSHTDALGHITYTTYPDDYTIITTDPLKRRAIQTCDAYDRILTIQSLGPAQSEIAREDFAYDLAHNKLSQTSTIYRNSDKRTSTLIWEYDCMNRVITLTEAANTPLRKKTQTTYTSTGQIATLTKPSGICLNYTYDVLDRLEKLTSSDHTIDYRYTYNGLSQLIYVVDPITRTTSKRKWDPKGRLLHESLANGYTLTSTYDEAGRRTSLKLPTGTVTYSYDAKFLRTTTFNDHTHRYTKYDLGGNLLEQELINNCGTVKYQIDALGRTISLNHRHYKHTLDSFDAAGNLLRSSGKNYTYDHLNHLICENDKTYTYDSHHNRDPVNALNQLPDITYDLDGNPTQSEGATYTYDALGRLTSIKQNNTTTSYTYDFLHRRLTAGSTCYLYDDKNEIGSDKELRILGLGAGAEIGASVLLQIDGYIYAPLHDLHGNLTTLFYNSDVPYQTYTFDAFSQTSTDSWLAKPYSPWRYSSKRHDTTGLIYFGRRYYDPARGRFLTPDPTGFTDGPNLYQYVLGNPLTHHDLYGEWTFKEHHRAPQPAYFTQGEKDLDPNTRLLHMNGLGNCLEEIKARTEILSSMHGGAKIHTVFEPNTSLFAEACKTLGSYFGFPSKPGKLLRKTILNLVDDLGGPNSNGQIDIYAHSKACSALERELPRLSPNVRSMLNVYAFGPFKPMPKDLAGSVINYIDKSDYVAMPLIKTFNFCDKYLNSPAVTQLFSPSRPEILQSSIMGNYNIEYTRNRTGHTFLGGSYQTKVEERGIDYVRKVEFFKDTK